MITIIAFFTMFIDHIGLLFFPEEEIWRIIWRIAFPLFAWWIVRWYRFTRNKRNYAKRIFILAIISQIPIFLLFWNQIFNICFTLLFWLFSLEIIQTQKLKIYLKFIFIWFLLYLSEYLKFDYSIYGILTIILLYIFWQQKKSIIYFTILTLLFYNIDYKNLEFVYNYQIYAIFAIFLLYFTSLQKYDFKLNFYFKYLFYPVHLSILYLILQF